MCYDSEPERMELRPDVAEFLAGGNVKLTPIKGDTQEASKARGIRKRRINELRRGIAPRVGDWAAYIIEDKVLWALSALNNTDPQVYIETERCSLSEFVNRAERAGTTAPPQTTRPFVVTLRQHLPQLHGSDRQIAWAEAIREELLQWINTDHYISEAIESDLFEMVRTRSNAAWWINRRFYDHFDWQMMACALQDDISHADEGQYYTVRPLIACAGTQCQPALFSVCAHNAKDAARRASARFPHWGIMSVSLGDTVQAMDFEGNEVAYNFKTRKLRKSRLGPQLVHSGDDWSD